MIRRWLRNYAYPSYECERCVGQEEWAGCYCDYHGAIAPCEPNTSRIRSFVRKIFFGEGT